MATLLNDDAERQDTPVPESRQPQVEPLEALAVSPEELQQEATPEVQPEPTPELPDKYQGKTLQEVIQMHQEAEKALGRQSGEVGELRKTVDQYIQTQLKAPQEAPSPAPAPVADEDFFDKPVETVNKTIEQHPALREAQEAAQSLKRTQAQLELKDKHPDMLEIVNDEKFAQWVLESPIRKDLFIQADQHFNYQAADELFSTWKQVQGVAQRTLELEEAARQQAVQQASGAEVSSTGEVSKKHYRRADIVRLMKNDPHRYTQLLPDIEAAYAEGRII